MLGMATLRFMDEHMLRGRQNLNVLDIGAQNAMDIDTAYLIDFLERYGCKRKGDDLKNIAKKLAEKSIVKKDVETLYLADIFEHTSIGYDAFDVAPAPRTIIFDLNNDDLPAAKRGHYDIVMNLGTTEHVFDQYRSMRLIHDATKTGGQMLHQVPASGWLEHGFFSYHPRFFIDIANANAYAVQDIFLFPERRIDIEQLGFEIRRNSDFSKAFMPDRNSDEERDIASFRGMNVNALLLKKENNVFSLPLETDTSHAAVDGGIAKRYLLHKKMPEDYNFWKRWGRKFKPLAKFLRII